MTAEPWGKLLPGAIYFASRRAHPGAASANKITLKSNRRIMTVLGIGIGSSTLAFLIPDRCLHLGQSSITNRNNLSYTHHSVGDDTASAVIS
ncbi:MAG: hypothetical protein CM15mP84_07270 [Cellvibrionales bacterium]|nr:MAG: hypothetical protein CM15mP84_07270 [Cellvibrionales bacterium]